MAGVDPELGTKVEIFLCARGLPKLDTFSNTDPFAIILQRKQGGYIEIGRTETIQDTNNPDFTHQIVVNYSFEEDTILKIDLFDRDSKSENLKKHDFIGTTNDFKLGKLIGAPGMVLPLALRRTRNRPSGTLTLKAEETSTCADAVTVHFAGAKLANKDGFFGKSDPFLVISRIREDGSSVVVWKSEVVNNNLNPMWKPATIEVQRLCNGDYDRPMVIEIFDWEKSGRHQTMGVVKGSLREIISAAGGGAGTQFDVIEEKKKSKRGYKNSGFLRVLSATVERRFTLLDYLAGGCQIGMMMGIDFTGSNGDPRRPGTLHYIDPTGRPNQYQTAIQSCGGILQEYDYDKMFPTFGFGGKLNGVVEHCFPITLNPGQEEVPMVDGILQNYYNAMQYVALSGPTLFAPIISKAMGYASQQVSQQNQTYTVLMIITDGVINDMSQTISLIVRASTLPLSIIIVGVGNADFSGMQILDGDDDGLRDAHGNAAVRDIVQFVAMRDFNGGTDGVRLAKEVLAEVPGQFLSYMRSQSIVPNPRPEYVAPPELSPTVLVPDDMAGGVNLAPPAPGPVAIAPGAVPTAAAVAPVVAPPIAPPVAAAAGVPGYPQQQQQQQQPQYQYQQQQQQQPPPQYYQQPQQQQQQPQYGQQQQQYPPQYQQQLPQAPPQYQQQQYQQPR